MLRKIIHIDEEKCTGCGLCASACHEGAIDIVGGKARLMRENFCDGFGDCLPACPADAISFEEREAPEYDEKAVQEAKKEKLKIELQKLYNVANSGEEVKTEDGNVLDTKVSFLKQWPCQIKLLPIKADFFDGCHLLIAADCTAYAYARMHERFMKDRVTLIGCPKLDGVDYSLKLTEIFKENDIEDILLVRMEVPCCGGMERAIRSAIFRSGKMIPFESVIISMQGEIII